MDTAAGDIDDIIAIGHRVWPEIYGFAGDEHVRNGLDTCFPATPAMALGRCRIQAGRVGAPGRGGRHAG